MPARRQAKPPARPTEPSLPKTAKGQRMHRALLDATARVLNRNGYQELRIADIAAEAGVPVSLFYRYFKTKADVTLQILRELVEKFRADLPADLPIFERELRLHRDYAALAEANPKILGCYFSYMFGEAAFAAFFREQTQRFAALHGDAVRNALGTSAPPASDILPVTQALIALSENLIYRDATGRDPLAHLDGLDLPAMLAVLRHRALLLQDPVPLPIENFARMALADAPRSAAMAAPRDAGVPEAWHAFAALPADPRRNSQAAAPATLQRIRDATLGLLDRFGYDDLRLVDIERDSGLTRGVIYHYFTDKRSLLLSVLGEQLDAVHDAVLAAAKEEGKSAFDALLALARALVHGFAETPGVLRTLYHLEGSDEEFFRVFASRRHAWAQAIAGAIRRYAKTRPKDDALLLAIAYALLAMTERVLYDVHVEPIPPLADAMQDEERLASFLAVLWHRIAFAADPAPRRLEAFPIFRKLRLAR